MDLQEHARFGGDGALVVVRMGLVGGAHFHHGGAGLVHDVGDAEGSADLDELAAGDHRLVTAGEFGEHHHHGRGVVVDRDRRLGARDLADEGFAVRMPAAARHGVDVVFKGAVAVHDVVDGGLRRLRHAAAAQVGVDDHARCVDDAAKRGAHAALDARCGPCRDRSGAGIGLLPGEDSLPCLVDCRPRLLDDQAASCACRAVVAFQEAEYLVDLGKLLQELVISDFCQGCLLQVSVGVENGACVRTRPIILSQSSFRNRRPR